MDIYLLSDPLKPARFASFDVLGTWSESPGPLCKECGDPQTTYVPPLQIEWKYGTNRIGDVAWGSYTCLVVDRLKEFLINNAFDCTFDRVEMLPQKGQSRIPRVAYPYLGPALSWLRPTKKVRLNEKKSDVRLDVDCSLCGNKRYTFRYDGISIDKSEWHGEKLFKIPSNGRSSAMFITEPALRQLEEQGFTNLCPTLAGEIED